MYDFDIVIGLRWIAGAVREGASPPGVPSLMETAADEIVRLRADLAEAREVVEYLENCLRGWASVGAVSGCTFGSIRVPKRYLEKAATRARAFIDRGA